MLLFPVFPAFSFISLKFVFYNAHFNNTVALLIPASSCIPVRVQPLRAFAEPPAGLYILLNTRR